MCVRGLKGTFSLCMWMFAGFVPEIFPCNNGNCALVEKKIPLDKKLLLLVLFFICMCPAPIFCGKKNPTLIFDFQNQFHCTDSKHLKLWSTGIGFSEYSRSLALFR